MIEKGQMCQTDFNNFRRAHRNRQGGEVFLIEVEITEEDWHELKGFPQDALGELYIRWTERTGIKEAGSGKKARKPKSDAQAAPKESATNEQVIAGHAWSKLIHRRGFCRAPGVWELIAYYAGKDDHAKMCTFFNVEHMRDVGMAKGLEAFAHPTAQLMIKRAWEDAAAVEKLKAGMQGDAYAD